MPSLQLLKKLPLLLPLIAAMTLSCTVDGTEFPDCSGDNCDELSFGLVASLTISRTETVARCGPPDIALLAQAGESLPIGASLHAQVFTDRAVDRTLNASFGESLETGLIPLRNCNGADDPVNPITSYFVEVYSSDLPGESQIFEFAAGNLKVGEEGKPVSRDDELVEVTVQDFEVDPAGAPQGEQVFARIKVRVSGLFSDGDKLMFEMGVRQADWSVDQMINWGTVSLQYQDSEIWGSGGNTEEAPGFAQKLQFSSDPGDPNVMEDFIVRVTLLKAGRSDLGSAAFEFLMKQGMPDHTSVCMVGECNW